MELNELKTKFENVLSTPLEIEERESRIYLHCRYCITFMELSRFVHMLDISAGVIVSVGLDDCLQISFDKNCL